MKKNQTHLKVQTMIFLPFFSHFSSRKIDKLIKLVSNLINL